ncbi:hypothetical protein O6H91_Y362200 [Diphasiastrum complanatum]|nr:hypothetical protein O6H91_Y362200 [Diphasiastrum complanatum]
MRVACDDCTTSSGIPCHAQDCGKRGQETRISMTDRQRMSAVHPFSISSIHICQKRKHHSVHICKDYILFHFGTIQGIFAPVLDLRWAISKGIPRNLSCRDALRCRAKL